MWNESTYLSPSLDSIMGLSLTWHILISNLVVFLNLFIILFQLYECKQSIYTTKKTQKRAHWPLKAFSKSTKRLRLLDTRFSPISAADPTNESGFATNCRNFWVNIETNMSHLRRKLSSVVPSGASTNFLFSISLENKMCMRSKKRTSSGFNSI